MLWNFFTNLIVTHLIAFATGAFSAWYATHKTIIAAFNAKMFDLSSTAKSAIESAKSDASAAVTDIEKTL